MPECRVPCASLPCARVPCARVPRARSPWARVFGARVPRARVPCARVPCARVPKCQSAMCQLCECHLPERFGSALLQPKPCCSRALDNCSITCSAHDAERCDTLLYSLLLLCFHPWLQICAVANSCCITAACPLQEKAGLTMSQHCNVEVGSLSVRSEHLQPWNSITAAQSVLRSCTPQCHGG